MMRPISMTLQVLEDVPAGVEAAGAIARYQPNTSSDALDELNAQRSARGLRPYPRDEGLSQAALACATYRAQHHHHGHMSSGMGDFQFVPPGTKCTCTGAEAPGQHYPPGFYTCAMYETHAGAGAARAFDDRGEQYMSLFCR